MAEVDTVSLGELRRTVEALRGDLGNARAELGALVAIPVQLDNMAALWAAQLEAAKQQHAADVASLKQGLADARREADRELAAHIRACSSDRDAIREDVATLQGWQTWAVRLVLGAVGLAIVAVALGAPAPPV